jgi:hypothetical protein
MDDEEGDEVDDFFASESFNDTLEEIGGDVVVPPPATTKKTNAAQSMRPSKRAMKEDNGDPPPEKPDTSDMNEEDGAEALKQWRWQCKAWTDRRARCRWRNVKGMGDLITYSGDASSVLQMMLVVEQHRLAPGDMFESKEILKMRIAKEAYLHRIELTTVRSNNRQVLVSGFDFYVKANNSETRGWVVTMAVC